MIPNKGFASLSAQQSRFLKFLNKKYFRILWSNYARALQEIGVRLYEIGRYKESLGRYWVAIGQYEGACNYIPRN